MCLKYDHDVPYTYKKSSNFVSYFLESFFPGNKLTYYIWIWNVKSKNCATFFVHDCGWIYGQKMIKFQWKWLRNFNKFNIFTRLSLLKKLGILVEWTFSKLRNTGNYSKIWYFNLKIKNQIKSKFYTICYGVLVVNINPRVMHRWNIILYGIHVCMHGMTMDVRVYVWEVNTVWSIWKVNDESSYWLVVLVKCERL